MKKSITPTIIGFLYTSTNARCQEPRSQLNANKDKLYTWQLQLDRDKLEYSKEWFPTSAETDQINSETMQDVWHLSGKL
jgi:hypothetical protein